MKQTKSNKIKRFRSPDINVKRLEGASKNYNNKKENYKRMRRRSGKLNPEFPPKQQQQESEETQRKLREYLELKKGNFRKISIFRT